MPFFLSRFVLALAFLPVALRAEEAVTAVSRPAPHHVDKIDHPKDQLFGDFRRLGWTDAFEGMHRTLAREYPFTAWRGLDWSVLHDRFRSRVAAAEKSQDAAAFYRAVREYIFSIPDGHLRVSPQKFGSVGTEFYGDFGFEAARLDDGRVIAYALHADGTANQAGLKPGAEIVTIDRRPTAEVIAQRSTLWCATPVATQAARELEQVGLLGRGPVGATVTCEFRNPGEAIVREAAFTGIDDRGSGRPALRLAAFIPHPDKAFIAHRILPSGIGYIALFAEMPQMLDEFKKALAEFTAAKVPGLILDLRLNQGGDDDTTAELCGYFASERRLYECCQFHNPATGTFDIADEETVYVEPRSPRFDRPVVALVGHRTISNGEGIAFQLERTPGARTLGFEATAGSFGESGGVIKLPKGIEVNFPYGACVDEKGRVLIDSDAHGNGGVEPQIKIPCSDENMLKFGQGIDVELQAAERDILQPPSDKRLDH